MKRFKYFLKILGLVFLMSLAAIGIGMTGAAPTFLKGTKRDKEEEKTELAEEKKDEKEAKEVKFG